MPTLKPKTRNPTDSTLRNVRAAAKRQRDLAARLTDVERRVTLVENRLLLGKRGPRA